MFDRRPEDAGALVWLRDDLRLADNPALAAAIASDGTGDGRLCLRRGQSAPALGGATRWWLHHSLKALAADLSRIGGHLVIRRGDPAVELPRLVDETGARTVTWNRRYEASTRDLDAAIKADLGGAGLRVESFNGHLLCEPMGLKTKTGDFYRVFTPFWKAARERLDDLPQPLPAPKRLQPGPKVATLSVDDLGLLPTKPDWSGGLGDAHQPGEAGARARLGAFLDDGFARYAAERDVPAAGATSGLSPHLRFGEISVRTVWHAARHHAARTGVGETTLNKFLAELGWREFSYNLLFHVPDLASRNFQPRFDHFPWRTPDRTQIRAWQRGETGYPIVDAGMRELWQTGVMHNRVRMIVASFLVKHLLVDWRVGEAWFWDTLCDADAANNATSWQWVAGSGADAAPYFRVFNPVLQGEKFDPDGTYVKRFVPSLPTCRPT